MSSRKRFPGILFAVLLCSALVFACERTESGDSDPDPQPTDGDLTPPEDGDLEELPPDDFVPHVPRSCAHNHCQNRRIAEGVFCLGHDLLNLGRTNEEGETWTEEKLRTLIHCGRDENNCPVEIDQTECPFGCDPNLHICKDAPPRVQLVLTVSRLATLESVAGTEYPAATSHSGSLWVTIFEEAREEGQPPSAAPIASAYAADVDLSEPGVPIELTLTLRSVGESYRSLEPGSYYLDAILKTDGMLRVDGNAEQGRPATGDLLHHAPVNLTAPEEGPCTAQVVFDRTYHEVVESWR